MRRSPEVYGFITDVTELADDGWYGNPGWATVDRAKDFTDVVADGRGGRHRGGDERAPRPLGQPIAGFNEGERHDWTRSDSRPSGSAAGRACPGAGRPAR